MDARHFEGDLAFDGAAQLRPGRDAALLPVLRVV